VDRLKSLKDRIENCQAEPILIVKSYGRDVVFKTSGIYASQKSQMRNHKRGKIQHFSYDSRRRAMLAIRNICPQMKVEAGLTYPKEYISDGETVKKHFEALREWFRRRRVEMVWVLEFQKRGAPHYHLLLSMPIPKKELAAAWYKIVGSHDPKHLKHGVHVSWIRSTEKMANYMSKYLTKDEQKHVPDAYINVGRFWGYSRKLLKTSLYVFRGYGQHPFRKLQARLRIARRWYAAKMRQVAEKKKEQGKKYFKWKWKGKGFVAWDYDKFLNSFRGIYEWRKSIFGLHPV
jgi:hypothetical protein